MTEKELETYDELIKLIIVQSNPTKVVLDLLKLVSDMKASYNKKENNK